MDLITLGILGFIALVVLLFLGMNVGFTMVAVGFVGYILAVNPAAALGIIKTVPINTVLSFDLSVIPLFVLMGQFCLHSGISTKLYNTCYKWLGRMKGGLSIATIGATALFATLCGSAPATAATMGTVCLPEMKKYNYKDTLATGCLAAGGTLGILIPPSVAFILYGITTSTSIGRLFAAGLFPGIVLTILYIFTIMIICRIDKKAGPRSDETFTWGEKFRALKDVIPMVILFVLVIGGIFAGLFTANEGAAIGAVGSFIFLVFSGRLSRKVMKAALLGTVKTTGMIFLILVGAKVFGAFLTITRLPTLIAGGIGGLGLGPYGVIIIILLIMIGLGCLMDELAMILLLVPIFYPLVLELGINPYWFGVMLVISLMMGQILPPVGINVFVIQGVAKTVPMGTVYRGVAPFNLACALGIAIVMTFPALALSLPTALYG